MIAAPPERGTPARWQADSALIGVALSWGATFVLVKAALASISVLLFLALRFSLASVCLVCLFAGAFRHLPRRALWAGLFGGAAAGIFLWLGYAFQTWGLLYTTATRSGFITGLYIAMVPLLGAVWFRKPVGPYELGGVALATAGLACLTLPGARLVFGDGDALTLVCAVAFAFHLLLVDHFSRRHQFQAVALGQIAAVALLSWFTLPWEPLRVHWSPGLLLSLALTSVVATAFAFSVQTWAQQHTTASRTAVIFALEPLFAFLTALAIGGERWLWTAAAGGLLILAGNLVIELQPRRPEPV